MNQQAGNRFRVFRPSIRTILGLLLSAGLLGLASAQPVPFAAPSADAESKPLSIDEVVGEVLRNSPVLRSARANWEAVKARIPQVRAWEDLRAGLDIERSGTARFDTFTDNEWMIAQELPLSGKNRKRAQAAAAEALAAFQELRRRELDLSARARAAWFRCANVHQQLQINRQNEELLRQVVELSRAKYEVGTQSRADVLLAETDLARVTEARFDIERQISDEESRLNVLMNRPAAAALGRPLGLAFVPFEISQDTLQSLALAHRPELLSARQKIAAAQARWELAKRAWIPDPELRIEARQFNGSGGGFQEFDTGIFFNFPWLNRSKYRSAIEEARQVLEGARYDLDASQRDTSRLIRDQLKKVTTLRHHYELFRGRVLPLAQQTVRAKQAAYETDKAGILDLIMARRTVHEVESLLWTHLTDYLVALAELEAVVGANPTRDAARPVDRHESKH